MQKYFFIATTLTALLACSNTRQIATAFPVGLDKQGHRGCRGLMPENTIPAMLKAMDLGVTTLELDVVISKDNKVVVSHDPYFNENITTTPEGKLLQKGEGAKRLLYSMLYDSIKKYDVGIKPHPDYPQQQKIAAYKPLLSDLIDATQAYAKKKGKPVLYNIEIKSKLENDGKKHPVIAEFVDLVMAVIKAKRIESQTTIQSFDPRALQVMQTKYSTIVTSFLMEPTDKRLLDEQLQELGYIPPVYSPHFTLVTSALVDQCRKKNIRIVPWTVNTKEEMRRLINLKVDGIITDYPNLFNEL